MNPRDPILARARAVFERVHRTPAWLRVIGALYASVEPGLVTATALFYLGWVAAMWRMTHG